MLPAGILPAQLESPISNLALYKYYTTLPIKSQFFNPRSGIPNHFHRLKIQKFDPIEWGFFLGLLE